jgi:hypothetical protein
MTKETLSYIDSRIKAITELEIQAFSDDNKNESYKLNAIKIELIDMKIFVCDQAMKEIKSQLNVLS